MFNRNTNGSLKNLTSLQVMDIKELQELHLEQDLMLVFKLDFLHGLGVAITFSLLIMKPTLLFMSVTTSSLELRSLR